MVRRRAITRDTEDWLSVQPTISIAGDLTALRSDPVEPPPPPSKVTPGATVPISEVSQTSPGSARARSRMARSQLKRLSASEVTVSTRLLLRVANWV